MPQTAPPGTAELETELASGIRSISALVFGPDDVQPLNASHRAATWQAIAERARDGEIGSLKALLEGLTPMVRRICRGVLGPRHPELEDAVQESLFAVVRALAAWRAEGELPNYASKITLRVALATRRRVRQAATYGEEALCVVASSSGFGGADAVLNAERAEVLRSVIQTLPAEQAEVLLLRFALGYTLEESAKLMDTPIDTAKSRIRMGKETLRRRLSSDARARSLFGQRAK